MELPTALFRWLMFSRMMFVIPLFGGNFCMVGAETGGLFRLAVGLMQAFSEDRRDYTPLLNELALYFQIRDDLINLSSSDYMKGKSYCEDLTVSGNVIPSSRRRKSNCGEIFDISTAFGSGPLRLFLS